MRLILSCHVEQFLLHLGIYFKGEEEEEKFVCTASRDFPGNVRHCTGAGTSCLTDGGGRGKLKHRYRVRKFLILKLQNYALFYLAFVKFVIIDI